MALRQHHMFLNPSKCNICWVEVEYLGNLIGRAGVRPTAEQTQALEKWPNPQNITELKSFLQSKIIPRTFGIFAEVYCGSGTNFSSFKLLEVFFYCWCSLFGNRAAGKRQ